MAGSAPSAFIFLMTALIVSAAVSAILVESWEGIADTYAKNRDKAAIDAKTEFSFAGNAMKVDYDSGSFTMTFYLQNTGEIILEDYTTFGNEGVGTLIPEGLCVEVAEDEFIGANRWILEQSTVDGHPIHLL